MKERAEQEQHRKDKWLVDHAFNEHHMVKDMLQELADARGEKTKMHAILTKLQPAVKAHVMEEEKIMFPDVRKMFDERGSCNSLPSACKRSRRIGRRHSRRNR